MRSRVAEETRELRRRRELAAEPEERVAMALASGDRLVELVAAQRQLSHREARDRLRREGARGRRRCSFQSQDP